MKLKVFREVKQAETDHEVTLRLVDEGDQINLMAIDSRDGQEWYLFSFYEDGTVRRCSAVPEIGFALDEDGHVEIEDE